MAIIQLDPQIPMSCPKGEGFAILLIDYSQDHDLYWTIAINETGELWTFANREVRMQKNITIGRKFDKNLQDLAKDVIAKHSSLALCPHGNPVKFNNCPICSKIQYQTHY